MGILFFQENTVTDTISVTVSNINEWIYQFEKDRDSIELRSEKLAVKPTALEFIEFKLNDKIVTLVDNMNSAMVIWNPSDPSVVSTLDSLSNEILSYNPNGSSLALSVVAVGYIDPDHERSIGFTDSGFYITTPIVDGSDTHYRKVTFAFNVSRTINIDESTRKIAEDIIDVRDTLRVLETIKESMDSGNGINYALNLSTLTYSLIE